MMRTLILALLPLLALPFSPLPTFRPAPYCSHLSNSGDINGDIKFTTPSSPTLDEGQEEMEETEEIDADTMPELQDVSLDAFRLGDSDSQDEPIDAPWRKAAEEFLKAAAESEQMPIECITWTFNKITVTVPSKTSSSLQAAFVQTANAVFEAAFSADALGGDVLIRHDLTVQTPGAANEITTQEQFEAWKGFDVFVFTSDPFNSNRTLKGKLHSRDAMDTKITVNGRVVTIPNEMIEKVTLPKAKKEKGVPDFEAN